MDAPEQAFAKDFGLRWNTKKVAILDLPEEALLPSWEACLRKVKQAKLAFDLEMEKARNIQVRATSLNLGKDMSQSIIAD